MVYRKISTLISFFVLFLVSVSFAGEHFVPITSYRTGPYGVNGAPAANGFVDYLKMVNAREEQKRYGSWKLGWQKLW